LIGIPSEGQRSMTQAQSMFVYQGSRGKEKRSSLHLQVMNVFANSSRASPGPQGYARG